MIRKKDLDLLEGEEKIKVENIFFEKSDKPSSRFGYKVPVGILMLTNRRLFFFSTGKGKEYGKMVQREIAIQVPLTLVRFIPFVGDLAGDLIDKGIEYGIEKMTDKELIYEQYIDKEDSFVISVEQIAFYEKHGSRFLLGLTGFFYYKKRYLKIGITDGAHEDRVTNYCIYSVNPKHPFNSSSTINIGKLYKEIKKVMELRSTYRYVTPVKLNVGAPFIFHKSG